MSITYQSQYKIISASNILIFLLIIPKINILDISNYHQGIRIENLISMVLCILILLNTKKFKINYDYKFYFFCFFIFLSYLVGALNNVNISIVSALRIFEYFVFLIFFSNFKLDYKKLIIFFKILFVVNLIFCFLQYHDIIGFYSSRGYIEPDFTLWRATGIFSGSWELSFITSVTYFIICHYDKKKISFYFFLTLIILYLAGNRGVAISFLIANLFLFVGRFKINVFHLVILFLILFISYFFVLKYYNLDFFILFESLLRLIFLNENIFADNFSLKGDQYYSWAYRLKDWAFHADLFNLNIFTNLFGAGYTSLYYESFILRVLFANGVIGFFVLCILVLKIKFYMIIFLLMAGLSLDYVVSFKMFIILFLYFKYSKSLKE